MSGFDGGKPQYFILSKNDGLEWVEVANISDPGEGKVVIFESKRLNAGQQYWYQLKSCNIINCSKESLEVKITVKGKMDFQWQLYYVELLQIDLYAKGKRYLVYIY